MFEAEVEMEKKSSNWLPLLLIILLAGGVLGGVGYLIYQSKTGKLTPEQAAAVITESLSARPATFSFHAGTVAPSVLEQPADPHYRLLEKAGYVKIAPAKGLAKHITVTAAGEKALSAFPEFKPSKETDGTTAYTVPLATRKLVTVSNITMNGLSAAVVEYTWKWEPNQMGDLFDAGSDAFNKFPVWDRQKLIEKYGADYFHGDPKKVTVRMLKTDKGWKLE